MSSSRPKLQATENFANNLEAIKAFLAEPPGPTAFEALLDELFGKVLPMLERFPDIGRNFLESMTDSAEAATRADALRERLPDGVTLRGFIYGDNLLLYARRPDDLMLLAIKHHRQLSFDLSGHWP